MEARTKANFTAIKTAPHAITKVSPLELIFIRTVIGRFIPVLHKRHAVNKHKQARENDQQKKCYNKQNADNRWNANTREIKIGDSVFVRQQRQHELTPNFNTTPYMVIAIRKTQIIAQNSHGHKITRNISHFKHVVKQQQDYDTDIDDDKQDNDEQRKFGNEQGQN